MDKFFTDDKLIYFICRIRANYAKKRSKKHLIHLLSDNARFNHHIEKRNEEEQLLFSILPHRKKWKKLGKKYRYLNGNQKINSIEFNTKSLFKTVKFYQKTNPDELFLVNLNCFIREIRESIETPQYAFDKPKIYPKPKDKIITNGEKNICRPICLYNLKDKIIISQTNKYLSSFLDNQFYHLSHAFRPPIKGEELVTHHTSVEEILKYRNSFLGKELYVSECDMSKFYDSVNHDIIHKRFLNILYRAKEGNCDVDKRAIRIFYKYLSSYNFVRDVLPFNNDLEYWNKYKIPNGEFGWVEKELVELKHYNNYKTERIGIPQGGAISGLIANIVLDYADNKVSNSDNQLLYIRFCDDMIMIHPDKEECELAIFKYKNALLDLKLVPHTFKICSENKHETFWENKSKSPYIWSSEYKQKLNFPWIGFVGYEIHFDGFTRVRKKSLKKEKLKQNDVILKINKAININRRARKGTILESAVNRLIGMSVGHIAMWNHSTTIHEMCWVNGFKQLKENKYLIRQLKYLDKNRNRKLAQLNKLVSKFEDPKPEEEMKRPKRKLVYYGKPFSYYYQTLKK